MCLVSNFGRVWVLEASSSPQRFLSYEGRKVLLLVKCYFNLIKISGLRGLGYSSSELISALSSGEGSENDSEDTGECTDFLRS